jgi:hypothetical protein
MARDEVERDTHLTMDQKALASQFVLDFREDGDHVFSRFGEEDSVAAG